jgi:hypothetical protein
MTKIISCVRIDQTRGAWRIEIKAGRKVFRTEHVFSTEATATAIAIHFEKAIKYAYGDKGAVGDHFVL